MRFFIALFAAAVLSATVSATTAQHPNLDAETIRQQQAQIRADALAGKGRYKSMKGEKREELFRKQQHVSTLLKPEVSRTTDLNEADQIALFNSLESIEAIVNGAENERMICERYKPTGSKRPKTLCKTVGERKAEQEASTRDIGKRNLECPAELRAGGGCRN